MWHHVRGQDALENGLKIIWSVQPQLQLPRRHTRHHCPAEVGNDLVHHPAEDSEPALVPHALLHKFLVAALLHQSLPDETEPQSGKKSATHKPRQHARGARVHDGFDFVDFAIPECRRGARQLLPQRLVVVAPEQGHVVLGENLEKVD